MDLESIFSMLNFDPCDQPPPIYFLGPQSYDELPSVLNPNRKASSVGPTYFKASNNTIPGLRPDAFCSRTNPSVILRDDDFYSKDTIQHVREGFEHFDSLMRPKPHGDSYKHYMANAAKFKAQQLILLAEQLEHDASNPAFSEVDHMRMAWLVGRIDRAMNLCWYERPSAT